MREIKFRAWDNQLSKMCFFDLLSGGHNYVAMSMPIMQYTGLKDVNGKEIYEGDIVRRWMGRSILGDDWKIMEIKLRYDDENENSMRWLSHYNKTIFDKDIEVIGNIYESPELLK